MVKISFTTLLLMGCIIIGWSQTQSINKTSLLDESLPEKVGMSSERLERIDKLCEEAVNEGNIPGVVTLVARNGKIVHWKAYGMSDNKKGRAMKKEDIFRVASQTKAITATAVMMLWEENKFRLDDPISKYIPEFKNQSVLKSFRYSDTTWTSEPVKKEITIRHLLTHTSGIGYGVIDGDERMKMIYHKAGIIDAFSTEDITIAENIKKLASLPLHHHPGEAYTYSEGLDVLGYFIELMSGLSFDEYLKSRIFDPLGMNDTRFYFNEEKVDRLVAVQHKINGNWEKYPITFYDPQYPVKGAKKFFSGGAGLSSTAKDYAVFLQMYLNGGEYNGIRLLSRTTIQSMMGNQIGDLLGISEKHLGLAFAVVTESGQDRGGLGSVGTFDWGGYFNTFSFADPNEKIIGIILKQTRGSIEDHTTWKFRHLVFQAIDD